MHTNVNEKKKDLLQILFGEVNIDQINLSDLQFESKEELIQQGLTNEQAEKIRAFFELTSIYENERNVGMTITDSNDLLAVMPLVTKRILDESYYVYFLNNSNQIMGESKFDNMGVGVAEIMEKTKRRGSRKILITHLNPIKAASIQNNVEVARNFQRVLNMDHIELVDYCICNSTSFVSLKRNGLFS